MSVPRSRRILATIVVITTLMLHRYAQAVDPSLPAPQTTPQLLIPPDIQTPSVAASLFSEDGPPIEIPPAPVDSTEVAPISYGLIAPENNSQGSSTLLESIPVPPMSADDCWVSDPASKDAFDDQRTLFVSRETIATYTLIPAGRQEVGFSTFNFQHVMASKHFPRLLVTPRFAWNLMNHDPQVQPYPGFNITDIPSQLYEVAVDATVVLPLSERWSLQGSIAPSLFTDFQNTTEGAFRLPSKLIAYYQWSEAATIAGGVVYLDRDDISTIGFFGLILGRPGEEWKAEILFPRARLAYRVSNWAGREHWIYVAQEYIGGGSWAMQHQYGMNDVVTYRDEKVLLGYEWTVDGQRQGFIEGGYVYDRELEFRRLGRGRLDSTGVFRIGLSF